MFGWVAAAILDRALLRLRIIHAVARKERGVAVVGAPARTTIDGGLGALLVFSRLRYSPLPEYLILPRITIAIFAEIL